MQGHAMLETLTGLKVTKVIPEEERVPDERGLRQMASLETCGQYHVFSVIIKDARLAIPYKEWGPVTVEQGEGDDPQTYCDPPKGVFEHCEGSYVAYDIRLPVLRPGEIREIKLVGSKHRGPKKEADGSIDRWWTSRWREHLSCEPPEGEPVVAELFTDAAPTTQIAFGR